MASTTAPDPAYRDAIVAVEDLVAKRVSFNHVEDCIDSLPGLDDEQRSALWLLALASEHTPETTILRRVVVLGPALAAV